MEEADRNNQLVKINVHSKDAPRTTGSALTDRNGLTWSMDCVRDLFKTHRMWPTFVGTKLTQHGVVRITPPVLLWNEQKAYLEGNESSALSSSNSSRKRRLEHSDDGNPVPGQTKSITVDKQEREYSQAIHPNSDKSNITATQHPPTASSASATGEPAPAARTCNAAEEAVRNVVFRDIHEKGFFLGPADVYGGDYSLYKGGGDPTRTHSVATVRVVSKGHKISARELLAFSRVQNQVAKSAVFAFVGAGASAATQSEAQPSGTTEVTAQDNDRSSSVERNGGAVAKPIAGVPSYIVINFRNVSDRV